jgi:crossover junction endodeoxyribonuclease RuvC
MRVMGIDPGSRITGIGVVAIHDDAIEYVHGEAIRAGDGELGGRLRIIFEAVGAAVERFRPDVVAVEQVFVARNVRSALVLGHARGSAICAAVSRATPVVEYSARQIKLAVVGSGSADKTQVQHMVRVLLGMRVVPGADEADALACAICHVNSQRVAGRIELNGTIQ